MPTGENSSTESKSAEPAEESKSKAKTQPSAALSKSHQETQHPSNHWSKKRSKTYKKSRIPTCRMRMTNKRASHNKTAKKKPKK